MNHQPFRDWLLSGEKLPAEQEQMLQEHVRSCESCQQARQTWREVESVFVHTPFVLPLPGFSSRWQTKILYDQQQSQKRRNMLSVGFLALLVLGCTTFLVYQSWYLIQHPAPFLAYWFEQLVDLLSIVFIAKQITSPYAAVAPMAAFFGVIFLMGLVSFLSVLWLATYRKLSLARRVA